MKGYAVKVVNLCICKRSENRFFPSKDLGVRKTALNGRIGNVSNT